MTEIGTRLQRVTLHITEGDRLTLSISMSDGTALATPVTLWWPDGGDGKVTTLAVSSDGLTAAITMTAAQVGAMLIDLAAAPYQRPQIDIGALATIQLDPIVHRTDRPNVAEEG